MPQCNVGENVYNQINWQGEGVSLRSRSRELSQGGDGCSLFRIYLCARQRESQAVGAARAGGTPKPAVGQGKTHLSGLGSFFLSRECRIILHFPMTASGRDIPMPLKTSLQKARTLNTQRMWDALPHLPQITTGFTYFFSFFGEMLLMHFQAYQHKEGKPVLSHTDTLSIVRSRDLPLPTPRLFTTPSFTPPSPPNNTQHPH